MIYTLALSIIGGLFNRWGGQGKPFNTKYRDIGVSVVICLILAISGQIRGIPAWLSLLPCALLMFGALTTYRYFLPKPEDYSWYHYSLHGFMVSLAIFPLMFFAFSWWLFWIRCIFCAIGLGVWSHIIKDDFWEEFGRGFILCLSIAILFLA